MQTLELENSTLREEASRCKAASDRLRIETARLEEQLNENEILITSLREEITNLREQERKSRETLQANQQVYMDGLKKSFYSQKIQVFLKSKIDKITINYHFIPVFKIMVEILKIKISNKQSNNIYLSIFIVSELANKILFANCF